MSEFLCTQHATSNDKVLHVLKIYQPLNEKEPLSNSCEDTSQKSECDVIRVLASTVMSRNRLTAVPSCLNSESASSVVIVV